ncbi:hypothetical protein LCGC14_2471740 [marine sediment metagenome]|uniref:Uncharacterized protein n=1 Tax=marine sediment metagenome TaxID=412755 RepID=A0A0F9BA54_9ZZZZ
MLPKISTCKVFSNFHQCCRDQRAWEIACEDQRNGSWRPLKVDHFFDDPDIEYLRRWILNHSSIIESEELVFLRISW